MLSHNQYRNEKRIKSYANDSYDISSMKMLACFNEDVCVANQNCLFPFFLRVYRSTLVHEFLIFSIAILNNAQIKCYHITSIEMKRESKATQTTPYDIQQGTHSPTHTKCLCVSVSVYASVNKQKLRFFFQFALWVSDVLRKFIE